jgi:hypothetical protein
MSSLFKICQIPKGSSSYGKASQETRSFSFQQPAGDDRYVLSNRTNVIYTATTLYSLYSESIIPSYDG